MIYNLHKYITQRLPYIQKLLLSFREKERYSKQMNEVENELDQQMIEAQEKARREVYLQIKLLLPTHDVLCVKLKSKFLISVLRSEKKWNAKKNLCDTN